MDETSPALFRRLNEHFKSIEQAENLNTIDFLCRYLSVKPVWITLAERFLIDHFRPAWNLCIDGFGDHDPGRGRQNSQRSWWDTMHPGRIWAEKLQIVKTLGDAEERLRSFLLQLES